MLSFRGAQPGLPANARFVRGVVEQRGIPIPSKIVGISLPQSGMRMTDYHSPRISLVNRTALRVR